jgi:N-methylhydantoinase A/oxoprolinase/acetone carboxylase beta subunit
MMSHTLVEPLTSGVASEAGWRIGVDTGGTFTDIVAVRDGEIRTGKVPSTPPQFERGVLNAIEHVG